MGDVSLNRPIKAEPAAGGIAKGNRVLDTMSAGWTDERHMLYISSMEASFVDQLYNHGNHPHNANGTGFKVLRRGVCGSTSIMRRLMLLSEVGLNDVFLQILGSSISGHVIAVVTHKVIGLEASVGDHESGTQANRKSLSVSHGREWEACKGEPQLLHESTEVSDQNFADDEAEVEADSMKACKKRRLSRTSHYHDECSSKFAGSISLACCKNRDDYPERRC